VLGDSFLGLNLFKLNFGCKVWWHTPVIAALGRLKQENFKFQASLKLKELGKSVSGRALA
jgi:hypothetical protein